MVKTSFFLLAVPRHAPAVPRLFSSGRKTLYPRPPRNIGRAHSNPFSQRNFQKADYHTGPAPRAIRNHTARLAACQQHMEIMSDNNLNIRTTLSAVNEASPAIRKVIADIEKLKSVAKSFSASFSNVGKAGQDSMAGFDRVTRAATAQLQGLSNVSKSAARNYASEWNRANANRLNDARRMYSSLDRLEAGYQRQLERRIAAERRLSGGSTSSRSVGRLPAPGVRSMAIGAGVAGAGIGSALKKRMEVQAAEVRSMMFGDLTKADVESLRKGFADKAGIKFGVGTSKVIDTAVEGLKAGIGKQFAGEFADLALKAQAGLDVDTQGVGKLLGRLATQMPWSKDRFSKILNAVAVSNNATAADGNEIIEAMRRSLSALATTKMTPEQLAAIDATGISLGVQPFKMGTFVSFLTSQVAGADSAHGQQANDLSSAANALGFGGRRAMAKTMRDRPVEAIQQILNNLAKMPEALRTKVAKQIGGREWMDELLTLVLGRDKFKDVLKDIESKPGFLDKTALQKIRSMQGRWASIVAAFSLVWEKVGAGFEKVFDQISDAFIGLADSFNADTVKEHVAALVDGLRQGFGLRDWGEAITSLARNFGAGTIAKWREFGKGFTEGIREFAGSLKTAFSALSFVGGASDSEGLGKLIGKLTGLTIALSLLSPMLNALNIFSATIIMLATANPFARLVMGFVALAVGLKRVLDFVSDKIFSVFVSVVDSITRIAMSFINTVRGWIGLSPLEGSGPSRMPGESRKDFQQRIDDYTLERLKKPTSYHGATEFSGRRHTTGQDLVDNLNKFTGKVERAAFINSGNGVARTFYAGGSGGGMMIPGGGGARSFTGGVPGLLTSKPGTSLPSSILGNRGIIKRSSDGSATIVDPKNVPSFRGRGGSVAGSASAGRSSSGASSVPSTGSAGSGDAVGYAQKFIGMNEYSDTRILAASLGGDVRGKSNAWCARFVNKAIASAGGKGTGSAVANSFQRYGSAVKPSDVKRNDVLLQTHGRGYNQPGGHVGMATGKTRMVNGRMQVEMISGNDGDSVRTRWINADDPQLMIRRGNVGANVPQGLTSQVPSSGVIQNVPAVPPPSPGIGGGQMRGGFGPTQIHINGSSHDPEALATLVQRRIDESMNWRLHDTQSEYT